MSDSTMTIALPLGGSATVRGMRGYDEDLLASRKKLETGEAIAQILANCTTSLREKTEKVTVADVDALKTPDRLALLLAIRRESYGDIVEATIDCASCKRAFSADVDLSQVTTALIQDGYTNEGFETTLDGSGETVTFDFPDGKAERLLLKANQEELVTQLMLSRLKAVSGVHQNGLLKWLKELPVRARRSLRDQMERVECGPQVTKTADCPGCGQQNEFQVHTVPGFFFPK